ncbi:MAG: serine hydrolase domain-containing protein [Acidobacteriaceae bacterium]
MQFIDTKAATPHWTWATRLLRTLAVASVALSSCFGAVAQATASDQQQQNPQLEKIARDAMKQYHLKSLIVQVRSGGDNVYTAAFGESMTGVPATPAMHFRNGAMAFTYMSTMLMELVDRGRVELGAHLSDFFPDLPDASHITLKNLANMTSGYADYVYTPELLVGTVLHPFRQWSSEELIHIGITKPMMFEPGENWGYSHTNYVILGRVLEKITQMPLAKGMDEYIFDPMGLKQTHSFSTPEIPQPVLHAFSSERRADLHVPPEVGFYEESTFWNPSWTTAEGAVQVTDITDMSKSMEAVGTGKLLSKKSYQAQVGPNLVGFGHPDPKCPVCRRNTVAFNYGLGVVNVGPWITQTKNFAGSGASVGYLPAKKLTVSVVTTYKPEAFNEKGDYANSSPEVFISLVNALAPNTIPKP